VPSQLKILFVSETDPIRWFYHTRAHERIFTSPPDSRTSAKAAGAASRNAGQQAEVAKLLARWGEVLEDEKQNTGKRARHGEGYAAGTIMAATTCFHMELTSDAKRKCWPAN